MSAATRESPSELAERALALAGASDVQVTVVREHALSSRFARSAPTQATAVDDTEVEILVVHDGHAALASTNRLAADALRRGVRVRAAIRGCSSRARTRSELRTDSTPPRHSSIRSRPAPR